MSRPDSRHRRRGFTLIEVLVGLAIFAMAAIVLGAAYANVITSYDAVSKRQKNIQEMRLIRALVLAEPDRKIVEEGGSLPLPDNRSAEWKATIEETTVADLFKVTLECELRDPTQTQTQNLKTQEVFQLLRPTWSDPVERDKLRAESKKRLDKREQS